MSRCPMDEMADEYMRSMVGVYADETFKAKLRRYRRIGNDVKALRRENMILSSDPRNMTSEDVKAILRYHRMHVGDSDMNHEISELKRLFEYCGNPAVSECLARYPMLRPHTSRRRKSSYDDDVYDRILEAADDVPTEDFRRLQAYTLVMICLSTGTRNKEIRYADLDDFDLRNWVFSIVHVKGEASYGQPRDVPIHPDIRPLVKRYVDACRAYKKANGIASPAFIVSKRSSGDYLATNSIRVLKNVVEKDLGIPIDLRTCRRTFGQRYLDAGLDIESVSVLMGHSNTMTTESYYCKRKNSDAIARAVKIWDRDESA